MVMDPVSRSKQLFTLDSADFGKKDFNGFNIPGVGGVRTTYGVSYTPEEQRNNIINSLQSSEGIPLYRHSPQSVGNQKSINTKTTATTTHAAINPNYYTHPSNSEFVRLRDSQQQVSTKPTQQKATVNMQPKAPVVGVEGIVGEQAAIDYDKAYPQQQPPKSLAARLAMPDQVGGEAWDKFIRDNRYNSQQVQATPYRTNTSLDNLYGYY